MDGDSKFKIHQAMWLRILNPVDNARAAAEAVRVLTTHLPLSIEMARRELRSQYAGQMLGTWWAVGHPLFMMAVFVFIFSVVFKVRIGGTYELPLDYITYLLSGLVPWLSFQQVMTKACTVLTGNTNLVKQVVFPLEVLPATAVAVNLLPLVIGFVVLVVYVIIRNGALPASYALLPILLMLQVVAMLGLAFAFAAVGVFLRDLKDFVQVFVVAGVYLMPIFYLPEWVPSLFKPLLYVNPFSYMSWCYQDALYFGRIEHPWAWWVFAVGSVVAFVGGYRSFRWLRPYLGSAL
ncbi:MAG: ABC transporter permease [Gammaproteobacteria bacterium]